MNLNERKPHLGIHGADGAIEPLAGLSIDGLVYIGYGVAELQEILQVKLSQELYEECALIRDELLRRAIEAN
ncbi:hypothetical protein D0C36_19020 [Mucilaginibacter conchicola]|uniref:Uncharacterized protein n=1 Tax=Mucilaginibacter conchicola TaxID=2303333 RepID=A0A372NQ26_9SPHI|nr:hypothetical protein [Mucilaginibacter conchicola]RFZ91036.1 hypothetical protein D0C36_19020 [Mucilaginibacter conchicola]